VNNQPPSRRRAAYAILIGGYINIGVVIVQGLLLVPLYLQYVGPQLYGAWLGSGDILGWLAVIDMGLASLMIQRIGAAYGRSDRQLISQYLTTGLVTQMALVILLFTGAVVISRWVPGLMGVEGKGANVLAGCIVLAGAASGINILNNGVAGFAIGLQRPVFMSVATLTGAVCGIAITIWLLLIDWGLWAIPIGWVFRDGFTLVGNTIYAVFLYRAEVHVSLRLSRQVLRDFGTVSPPMFLAKLGGAFAGRSEAALIAIFIKPELATVYVLTRRAADILRMLLDRFGAATFAGFANLIGTGHRARAADVYKEIMDLFAPVAIFSISIYLSANQTFMSLWVGNDFYGGELLTTLIGLSVLVSAGSNLVNYLYSATGKIARGSMVLLVEGLVRLGLMGLLLWWLKLPGLPIAIILTGAVASSITLRWTRKELGEAQGPRVALWKMLIYGGLLALGAALGTRVWAETWPKLVLLSLLIGGIYLGAVGSLSPSLQAYFIRAIRQIKKQRVWTQRTP
jgi:hypothetical protein